MLIQTLLALQMIHRFGEVIDNTDSIAYWAAKHNIPIFCPPLTDGSIGDMMFFHSYKSPGLRCVGCVCLLFVILLLRLQAF